MNEETKTPLTTSSQSLTVGRFEQQFQKKRASFNELILSGHISDKGSQIISNNPVLRLLNERELLFFSTEYREDVNAIHKKKYKTRQIPQLSNTNNVNEVICKSLTAFDTTYNNCSKLAKEFLMTSTNLSIEKPHDKSNNQSDSIDFHGLSVEAIPYCIWDKKAKQLTRMESYSYYRCAISICLQNLPFPLSTNNNSCIVLAHELTHAIDDTHTNLNSCKVLFNTLHNKAHNNAAKQEAVLECASKIVDNHESMFTNHYLSDLKNLWFTDNGKPTFYDWANYWVEEMNNASTQQNVFVGSDKQGNRGLKCGSVPTEFLTFSIEHVFNALENSNNPEEFTNNYQNTIRSQLSACDNFAPEIKKAAFELIKDTTTPHLTLLMNHSSSEELKSSLGKAIEVLEHQCSELSQSSSTMMNLENRKRPATTPNDQDRDEKRITEEQTYIENNNSTTTTIVPSHTSSSSSTNISSTTDLNSARKSASSTQEHLYSKDDSGVDEIVNRMLKRLSSTKATSNTAPTTPTTKTMPERRRSHSI